jgi:hypothetical protein
MSDQATLERELAILDARRLELDAKIRDAVARQRYSRDLNEAQRAREEERAYALEMDRLMTSIRALEGRILLHRKGDCRWR